MSAVTSAVRFERVYRGLGIRPSEDAGAGSRQELRP